MAAIADFCSMRLGVKLEPYCMNAGVVVSKTLPDKCRGSRGENREIRSDLEPNGPSHDAIALTAVCQHLGISADLFQRGSVEMALKRNALAGGSIDAEKIKAHIVGKFRDQVCRVPAE
jgi:hypothetical protein